MMWISGHVRIKSWGQFLARIRWRAPWLDPPDFIDDYKFELHDPDVEACDPDVDFTNLIYGLSY